MFVLYAACSQKGSFHSRGLEGGGGGGRYGPLFLNFLDPPLLLAGPFAQGFTWYCLNRGGAFFLLPPATLPA